MRTTSSTAKIRTIVFNALFIALIFVMQMFGIGIIRMGIINISFLCTVIAIGTLTLGLKSGLIQGFAFGTISLIMAIQSPSALVAPIMAKSIPLVVLMCYLPRLLFPAVTQLTYRLAEKKLPDKLALALSGAAGSITNSVFYLGLMILGYLPMLADHPGVLASIGGIALSASIPEFLAAGVITPALVTALRKVKR